MPSRAWQRYSHIEAGASGSGISTTKKGTKDDVYQEAIVKHAEKSSPTAEATFWGLNQTSWNEVSEGDPLKITLGHTGYDGVQLPVFLGIVTNKAPRERDGGDFKYRLEGAAKGRKTLANIRRQQTWHSPNPGDVARDIASMAGLAEGEIQNAPGQITQTWSINPDAPLAHHLNRLKKEAQALDEQAWQWYASAGKLYFFPKNARRRQSLILKSSPEGRGNLIRIEESSSTDKKSDGGTALDFEAVLDPRIEFDGLATVQGAAHHNGTYRVAEYTLTSSSQPGTSEHKMEGTLEPTSAEYRLENGREVLPDTTGATGGRLTRG